MKFIKIKIKKQKKALPPIQTTNFLSVECGFPDAATNSKSPAFLLRCQQYYSCIFLGGPTALQIWPQIARHRHTSFDVLLIQHRIPDAVSLLYVPWIAIWLFRFGCKFQVTAITSSMSMHHLIHDAVLLLYVLWRPSIALQIWPQIPRRRHTLFGVNATPDPRGSVTSVFSLGCQVAFQMWLQILSHRHPRHPFFDVNATLDPRRKFGHKAHVNAIPSLMSMQNLICDITAIPSSFSMQHLIQDAVLLLYVLGWPYSSPNLAINFTSLPYLL